MNWAHVTVEIQANYCKHADAEGRRESEAALVDQMCEAIRFVRRENIFVTIIDHVRHYFPGNENILLKIRVDDRYHHLTGVDLEKIETRLMEQVKAHFACGRCPQNHVRVDVTRPDGSHDDLSTIPAMATD